MQVAIENYTGCEGLEALTAALREMVLFEDSEELAAEVAARAEVTVHPAGDVLIEEGGSDHEMYFVLSGQLQLCIKDREFALLGPGAHVGEFAVIDPNVTRCATVRALEETVTAKLSAPAFAEIASRNQTLWRNMSRVLGSHLRAGNRILRRPNARPRLVICTSEIGWPFAQAIKTQAADSRNETPAWVVEVRCLEESDSIEVIEDAFADADLGVIVVAPGDFELLDGMDVIAGRDALFLQSGICLGSVGRNRTVLVQPSDLGASAPTAPLGLDVLTYRLDPYDALKSDINKLCNALQEKVRRLGAK